MKGPPKEDGEDKRCRKRDTCDKKRVGGKDGRAKGNDNELV